MYKLTLTLAFAAIANVALAQPACLLGAVNQFDHPADQKSICKESGKVESYLKTLCAPGDVDTAFKAFKDACDSADYDTSDSSSSSSSSSSGKHTKSAPYPVVYTTTYYDEECTCTKTTAVSSTYAAGSTGFATGTAPVVTGTSAASAGGAGAAGPGVTGSPIAPAVSPSATGSSKFTGAASQNMVSSAGALFALAALVMVL